MLLQRISARHDAVSTKEMVPNEESQSILPKLNRILDATIDAAKLAARIGVSFTPMNDFVDFCEFATERENCLPSGKEFTTTERGLSALGLIAGSGKFWRGLGDLLGVPAIRAVVKRTDEISATAHLLPIERQAKHIEKLARLSRKVLHGVKFEGKVYRRIPLGSTYSPWSIHAGNSVAGDPCATRADLESHSQKGANPVSAPSP